MEGALRSWMQDFLSGGQAAHLRDDVFKLIQECVNRGGNLSESEEAVTSQLNELNWPNGMHPTFGILKVLYRTVALPLDALRRYGNERIQGWGAMTQDVCKLSCPEDGVLIKPGIAWLLFALVAEFTNDVDTALVFLSEYSQFDQSPLRFKGPKPAQDLYNEVRKLMHVAEGSGTNGTQPAYLPSGTEGAQAALEGGQKKRSAGGEMPLEGGAAKAPRLLPGSCV